MRLRFDVKLEVSPCRQREGHWRLNFGLHNYCRSCHYCASVIFFLEEVISAKCFGPVDVIDGSDKVAVLSRDRAVVRAAPLLMSCSPGP